MKLAKGTKFRTRSGNEYMIAKTTTSGVHLDFHDFFYSWDLECGDWVITSQPVLCGCRKHEIDPTKPVHDQHRKWMLQLGGIEDIKEGIVGEVVEYRTAFTAQVDEQWGEEFEQFLPGDWEEIEARGFQPSIIDAVIAWWSEREKTGDPLPDGFTFTWELLMRIGAHD